MFRITRSPLLARPSIQRALTLALAVSVSASAGADSSFHRWSTLRSPSPGPARVMGRPDAACIAGAEPLPLAGPGYRTMDVARRRHFGHPALLGFITALGRKVEVRGLGTLLVGDMAQPRGGPMPFGHVSHQGGLDVDIAYGLDVVPPGRRIEAPAFVDRSGRPDPARWTARQAELVRLAADDPRVSRVFVGAAIKEDLCARAWADRSWLRVVRPWPGHDDHLHVRLHCPADSPLCIEQGPLPRGEGCAAKELARWRAFERRAPRNPRPVVPPAPCRALLEE